MPNSQQKASLHVIYLNAKKGITKPQRTLETDSLVMQIGFTGKSCFNFHEIALHCKLVKVVDGKDLAGVPISCHAQPNTAGDQVTLEYPVDQLQGVFKILITAVHTQSRKPLSSLTTETPEILVACTSSPLGKRTRKEVNCIATVPQTKAQKLTESQDQALHLFTSSDLLSFEDLFNFDFSQAELQSSPLLPTPELTTLVQEI